MRNPVLRISAVGVLTALVALTTVVTGPPSIAQPPAGVLTLAKSASPELGLASGDTVTYTFVVTNNGTTAVSGIAVEETAFTGSGGAPGVTCESDTVDPGQSVTCTADYEVTDADQAVCLVTNTAVATGDAEGTPVRSAPDAARVVTDCAGDLAGSAILPAALGSADAGSLGILAPLALGSLGVGSLGSLGALGGLIGVALTTPYQPAPAAQCLNPPFPNVPFPYVPGLTSPCPGEQNGGRNPEGP
ncbi:DUF11 domain-containing protein [Rhodococcus hoagii]|uniref:DUF11 domain-containing protein n=2 Tax=Rhodococcus hoagii TaxID=43767 RepID=A0AAE2W676_RHOHA|nr:DUF11 domain-containing protein [Prescottella equi]MBM4468582.1 DUF11 domain-containing protein [Prescottella equi]MBM4534985.1 DUF11 domain-containing protein [Prescottella equi]MBM4540910.1 DUF11 domain-containing protein [Prescottella equi]MBM4634583.1 DUF11 domain-containing protein [Prescottella equi]MBM4714799.1 DUF11 domain-containing protein [Prescottella equi]